MNLSKSNEELLMAYNAGYRIEDGVIYNPKGKVLKGFIDNKGYNSFHATKDGPKVMVHRLVAYQKFGPEIFKHGLEVRHLDEDSENNEKDNIDIGTHSDNMMDQSEEARLATAINASNNIRKFTDDEMQMIRQDHKIMRSYRDVMALWDISSKGTLHHILNNKYVTTKCGEVA